MKIKSKIKNQKKSKSGRKQTPPSILHTRWCFIVRLLDFEHVYYLILYSCQVRPAYNTALG